MRLVKRIEVASIRSDDGFNDAYVKLLKTDNQNGIKARVEIHKQTKDRVKPAKVTVKQGDDLYVKSGGRANYRRGYSVQNIDCTPGAAGIELSSGCWLKLGQEIGGLGDEVMKMQVYETIKQHLRKEHALKGRGIKVLSLFFIDKVANYRIYNDDGSTSLGKRYQGLIPFDVAAVHNGYFSRDKQGHDKDTRGNTLDDADTYSLIMREKERLLDPAEPLRFIFSHSALREGWDNPNVFQICTLNETQSVEKKRQEIGRGLRLPVNQHGERVHDENVNRLTVIANESYEEFAKTLQNEFEKDFGIRFGKVEKIAFAKLVMTLPDGAETPLGQEASARLWLELIDKGYLNDAGEILDKFDPDNDHFELKVSDEFASLKAAITDEINKKLFKNRIADARKKRTLKFHKKVYLNEDFVALWERIKHRTRYRVSFDTNDLIKKAAERLKELEPIEPVRITMTRVDVNISGAGIDTDTQLEHRWQDTAPVKVLPDILAFLQKETELTRHALVQILRKSGRLDEFMANPQAFMAAVAKEISHALNDLILDGIQYEKIAGQQWEMSRIEQDAEAGIVRYLSRLYEVQNRDKTLFDRIELYSEVERRFAKDLDNHEQVRLFVKLPWWFQIDTPVGPHNPDWAFVTERDEKLYFVRENKGSLKPEDRRKKENQKVHCGGRHFEAIGVNYDVVKSLSEVKF